MICHGQGDPRTDQFDGGCCYIAGEVCPSRWFVDYTGAATTRDAHLIASDGTDLGTVNSYVKSVHNGKPRQDRVVSVIEGRTFVCGALADTVAADGIPTGANWEDDFEAAWSAAYDPGGSAEVTGDAWAAIGKPRNWCVSYGPGEGQCCFSEDQATNDARASNISVTSVTVASRTSMTGGG